MLFISYLIVIKSPYIEGWRPGRYFGLTLEYGKRDGGGSNASPRCGYGSMVIWQAGR